MNPGPMKKPTNSAALAAAFGRSENAVVTRLVRLRAGLLPEPAVSFGNAPEESSKPEESSAQEESSVPEESFMPEESSEPEESAAPDESSELVHLQLRKVRMSRPHQMAGLPARQDPPTM